MILPMQLTTNSVLSGTVRDSPTGGFVCENLPPTTALLKITTRQHDNTLANFLRVNCVINTLP